jgi:hypothetical protein
MSPSSVTCSLCSKFREKRIRCIAVRRHRVFPVTRDCYSSKLDGVAMKKHSDTSLHTI